MGNWIYGDIGFDTLKKWWVFQQHDPKGDGAGNLTASKIVVRNGTTFQYSWPDGQQDIARNFWHIRQRILSPYVSKMSIEDGTLVIECIPTGIEPNNEVPFALPNDVTAVEFAYSLDTGKGFVNLVDASGSVIKQLRDRWVITENLNMFTVGEYPKIRLRASKEDIAGLVITGTTCTIVGQTQH